MNSENKNTNANFVSMVSHIVAEHSCKIIDVDFENNVLNLDGPDDAVAECAQALAELFD